MTRRDFALVALGATGCGSGARLAETSGSAEASPAALTPVSLAEPATPAVVRGKRFQRGVNYTAEHPDRYGSEHAKQMLCSLPDYGIDSIALVPYGMCRMDSPEIRFNGRRSWERDDAIAELIEVAHGCGIRVLLKPQIWVRRGFPGDLDFASDADIDTWFAGYERFLEHYTALATAAGADLFSIGVEFARLTRHEARWRRLIKVARDTFGGPLVYAANWGPEFETVRFWDALDFIGLNNYYPLPDDLDTAGVVAKVSAVQRRFGRPVLFPEAGFASMEAAHRKPWAEERGTISLDDQARSYEAVFRAFYEQPWFEGMYWWKVGTNGFGGPEDGSHTPWGKPAMDVMARWYRLGSAG